MMAWVAASKCNPIQCWDLSYNWDWICKSEIIKYCQSVWSYSSNEMIHGCLTLICLTLIRLWLVVLWNGYLNHSLGNNLHVLNVYNVVSCFNAYKTQSAWLRCFTDRYHIVHCPLKDVLVYHPVQNPAEVLSRTANQTRDNGKPTALLATNRSDKDANFIDKDTTAEQLTDFI